MSTMQRVVLVGGGHAHLEVLRRYRHESAFSSGAELILVSDRSYTLYSGMLPGWLAGEYDESELSIDLAALAAACGARFVEAAASRIDAKGHCIELSDGSALSYDLASLDIGSSVTGLDTPGVRERAIPARPVARLMESVRGLRERQPAEQCEQAPIAIVGAGAAGVEIALALRASLAESRGVMLVDARDRVLAGFASRLSRRLEHVCDTAGIALHLGRAVVRANDSGLVLADESQLFASSWLWATDPAASSLARSSGLSVDAAGFVRVAETLQSVDSPDLFAAGDCAALDHAPETPRAGVFAVRAGPILAENLVAQLSGRRLRAFRPQRHFLVLLNLADGRAIGSKWGLVIEGRSVRRLKNRIDRQFVARYQRLYRDVGASPGR